MSASASPSGDDSTAWLDLTIQELQGFLVRVQPGAVVAESDFDIIKRLVSTVTEVTAKLSQKDASIAKLRALFGGIKTEKTASVLGKQPEVGGDGGPSPSPPGNRPGAGPSSKKKRPGHGRNGADRYSGADRVRVPHEDGVIGSRCEACSRGTITRLPDPARLIRVVGTPCLSATIWELARGRCGACGEVFTAEAPEEARGPKYDATAGSMISVLRYGNGFPNHRLEKLQEELGIPVPASVQYEIASEVVDTVGPAYQCLLDHAAQAGVIHIDDTGATILKGERPPDDASGKAGKKRTGTFTTGIVARHEDRDIALFFTGRNHAGENLIDLLQRRLPEHGPPIQVCDALSRNFPAALKTVLSKCLAHGRRTFVDVVESFPAECERVLEALSLVYKHDAEAREQQLSPSDRLKYHQEHSRPVMDALHAWLRAQFDERRVEPNSTLGKSISYMLNHWDGLTLFLRHARAPLDNNICERSLKMAILSRKNSLFYKTDAGAAVGDTLMSLIATCRMNKVNSFDYLTQLQRNSEALRATPGDWMPWNYKLALARVSGSGDGAIPTASASQ